MTAPNVVIRSMGAVVEDDSIGTRQSLLVRIRNRDDHKSWQEFFDRYWRLIYDFARQAGLENWEAEEVVQETVLSVCRKIPEFTYDPNKGHFKGWLLRLTTWRIRDQVRKRTPDFVRRLTTSTEGSTSTADKVPDPKGFDPAQHWDLEWERNQLAVAVERVKKKVSPKQYQVFELYALKHWPASKVADFLGIRPAAVYLTKHRVTLMLKWEIRQLKRNPA